MKEEEVEYSFFSAKYESYKMGITHDEWSIPLIKSYYKNVKFQIRNLVRSAFVLVWIT